MMASTKVEGLTGFTSTSRMPVSWAAGEGNVFAAIGHHHQQCRNRFGQQPADFAGSGEAIHSGICQSSSTRSKVDPAAASSSRSCRAPAPEAVSVATKPMLHSTATSTSRAVRLAVDDQHTLAAHFDQWPAAWR